MVKRVKMSQCAASKLHLSQKNLITNHHRLTRDHVVASTLTEGMRSAPFKDPKVCVKPV